jgi:hypothetical protein
MTSNISSDRTSRKETTSPLLPTATNITTSAATKQQSSTEGRPSSSPSSKPNVVTTSTPSGEIVTSVQHNVRTSSQNRATKTKTVVIKSSTIKLSPSAAPKPQKSVSFLVGDIKKYLPNITVIMQDIIRNQRHDQTYNIQVDVVPEIMSGKNK